MVRLVSDSFLKLTSGQIQVWLGNMLGQIQAWLMLDPDMQDLMIQLFHYKWRDFRQKGWNCLIGNEKKTKQPLEKKIDGTHLFSCHCTMFSSYGQAWWFLFWYMSGIIWAQWEIGLPTFNRHLPALLMVGKNNKCWQNLLTLLYFVAFIGYLMFHTIGYFCLMYLICYELGSYTNNLTLSLIH